MKNKKKAHAQKFSRVLRKQTINKVCAHPCSCNTYKLVFSLSQSDYLPFGVSLQPSIFLYWPLGWPNPKFPCSIVGGLTSSIDSL